MCQTSTRAFAQDDHIHGSIYFSNAIPITPLSQIEEAIKMSKRVEFHRSNRPFGMIGFCAYANGCKPKAGRYRFLHHDFDDV